MRAIMGSVLALVVSVGLIGPSDAIAPTDSLPRGADTTVPYLALLDTPVIKAPGVDLPLPPAVTSTDDYFRLVGRTDRGWLVNGSRADGEGGTDHDSVHLVTATGSTRLLDVGHYWGSPAYRLATSGKRFIRYPSGDMLQYLTVYDLAGRVIANRRVGPADPADVWDFSGSRVLYANRSWRIGHRPHVLTKRRVYFGDIAHNTLVVKATGWRRAFATLTHPHQYRWRARFQPDVISPSGRRVVGWAVSKHGGLRNVIQVRRLKDGKILGSIDVSNARPPDSLFTASSFGVHWQTNRAFVFVGQNRSGSGLSGTLCL